MSLACGVSWGPRYKTEDVLRLIQNAINPPVKYVPRLESKDYKYREGACFPAELPAFHRNSFQLLSMDSDSVHFAEHTLHALDHVLNCRVAGKNVGESEMRGAIEGFFAFLARTFEVSPAPTGNRPDSPARRNPEKEAVRKLVNMSLAAEVLDILHRNYNVTPQVGLYGLSPLQRAQEMAARGRVFRNEVGEFRTSNLYLLLPRYRSTLGFLRKKQSGAPIGVRLNDGFYTSRAINKDMDLRYARTQDVTIYLQENACYAFVVPDAYPDRAYRVALIGPLSSIPHTLAMRQLSMSTGRSVVANNRARNPDVMLGMMEGLELACRDDVALKVLFGGILTFADRAGRDELTRVAQTSEEQERLTAEARELARGMEEDIDDQDDAQPDSRRPEAVVHAPSSPRIWTPQGPDRFGVLGPRTRG